MALAPSRRTYRAAAASRRRRKAPRALSCWERIGRRKRHENKRKAGRDDLDWKIAADIRRFNSKRIRDALDVTTNRTELGFAMVHPHELRLRVHAFDRHGHRPDSAVQSRIECYLR